MALRALPGLRACRRACGPDPRAARRRRLSGAAGGELHGAAAAAAPAFGDTVRGLLEGAQAASGLPWWATLAACGVGLRLGLLPLSTVQATHIRRLQPVLPALVAHLKGATGRSGKGEGEGEGAGWGGVRAALREARCSPLLIVGVPVLQIATFITGTVGVRNLALNSGGEVREALGSGGCLWFTDLTVPDALWALPVLHVTVVLLNLELGLGSVSGPAQPPPGAGAAPGDGLRRVVGTIHTGLNMTMLTVFPLLCELPQAVFVFWLSSSTSSLAYQLLLKPHLAQGPAPTPAPPPSPLPESSSAKPSSTTLPEGLAADMRHVKKLIGECSWADAPATPELRDRLQELLDGERERGEITARLLVVLEKGPPPSISIKLTK